MCTRDWRQLREKTRAANHAGPEQYDLRVYHAARAWEEATGQPAPVRRARAFAAAMENLPLHIYDEDHFVGSRIGYSSTTLPDSVSEAEYTRLAELFAREGKRNFLAGNDHTLGDYQRLLAEGLGGTLDRLRDSRGKCSSATQHKFLDGVEIALDGFTRFITRYAELWEKKFPGDAYALSLRHLTTGAPRNMHEAMQLVWFVHMAFVADFREANALGRMDQYLLPCYQSDVEKGIIDREGALDILCHLWSKIEELGEITNICIGGMHRDGTDATNELSYLMLEATRLVLSPHTNLSARFHDGSPERFHRECFETIRSGVGFPAIFNDHVNIPALEKLGIPPERASDHCMVGCIEPMLPGRQPAWSDSRFNMAQVLLETVQHVSGQPSLEKMLEDFYERVDRGLARHIDWVRDFIAGYPAETFSDPFLSALTRDCIERGRDINAGGTEYPRFHGVAFMGLATVVDSLSAMRIHILDSANLSFEKLRAELAGDFRDDPQTYALLQNRTPHYGNGNPEVDALAARIVSRVSELCLRYRLDCGGRFLPLFAANVQNISAGAETGATPDGRRAGEPLSDAASPFFGRDRRGPTAFMQSIASPDYSHVPGGSVVNIKFSPEHFSGEDGARLFVFITRVFVRSRIQEMQFNFTSQADLEEASRNPEKYGNLVVRVSGFSAYFTRLDPKVQRDVINRRSLTPKRDSTKRFRRWLFQP